MELETFEKAGIKTSYCIDLDTRDRQVAENLARIPGRVQPCGDHDERIAIVCYGPSLEDTWEQVRDFDHIITVSGAHRFLLDKGISPIGRHWKQCEVDPRAHKADLIGKPHPDIEYMLASVCHPKVFDLLEGYNVKLWHVFAHETSRERIPVVYPRGDWSLTGGSNCGLRAMVLARFLGFKKMTIFGMDYSFKNDGTQHAGWHPKEIPNVYAVPVGDETYFTNPPMHQYAQQFFNEITKLGNIEIAVEGRGLLQAQIREHLKTQPLIPPNATPSMIAATSPLVITPEYSALNRKLHETDPSYGISGSKRADTVRKLIEGTKPSTILDYGCGKGTLAASLSFPIWEYDPCVPGKDSPPRPADLVVLTDVLEHIEPECLHAVLLDVSRCTLKVCYAVINTGPALKKLADGRNAHIIQQPLAWWKQQLEQFFSVAKIDQQGAELVAILGPRPKNTPIPVAPVASPSLDFSKRTTPVRHDHTEVRFHTPNDQTQWRANSLITKEPSTIAWIDTFRAGDVLYDIGANVGGYSVWAAKRRGVKVLAFEPEGGNYGILCRNLTLNEVDGAAYCLAVTDQIKISGIFLSSQEVGGACNSFDQKVGPDLKERNGSIRQGCIGYPLDELVKHLPLPDHIKIDVDGLEHKVIAGAKALLESGRVRSVLVEVNTNLAEHKAMLEYMSSIGYGFDPAQVESAMRKEGSFKGCAEYVFSKRVAEAPLPVDFSKAVVQTSPFPWTYVEDIFEPDTYREMLANLPADYTEIAKSRSVSGYPQRFTASPTTPFWTLLFGRLRDGRLKKQLCEMFNAGNPDDMTDECLLIRDLAGYKIGPHTDSARKVITVLFYLPLGESLLGAGTSIYEPNEPGFKCKGGPHYEFDAFKNVKTMPFKPNSVFAFLKTDNSFHGVAPCTGTRNVLLYDIQWKRK